ncbi:MAG: beta-galactosidase [Anaerolineales bacterium]|nr:beta-galactosidase [Anaerolineales bacterium]
MAATFIGCYCPVCTQAFQEWLCPERYKSVDVLNDVWGTTFWSLGISDWADVPALPNRTTSYRNRHRFSIIAAL